MMATLPLVGILLISPLVLATTTLKDGACVATIKCDTRPKSCKDVEQRGPDIYQWAVMDDGMDMLCDTQTEKGGWLVIQKRIKGDLHFDRDWEAYKYGFGSYEGDFWWGLEHLYHLTTKARHELYITFDYKGKSYFARYDYFKVYSERENYRLSVSGYSGSAGDSLGYHNNAYFTTKDRDNDRRPRENCAELYKGGWWHVDCHHSHLNGLWGSKEFSMGVIWRLTTTQHDSATNVVIRIRRFYDWDRS